MIEETLPTCQMARASTPSSVARRVDAERNRERILDAARADSAAAILVLWLRRFDTYFTSKRVVAAELLEHAERDDPVFGAGYARVLAAGRPLLRAAQQSGALRTDLTLEQILDMVAAIAKIPGDPGYREPILRAALDAL